MNDLIKELQFMQDKLEMDASALTRKMDGNRILLDCKLSMIPLGLYGSKLDDVMHAVHQILVRCKAERIDPLSLFNP